MATPTMDAVLRATHDPLLNPERIAECLKHLREQVARKHQRFLNYYRNPESPLAAAMVMGTRVSNNARPWRQYQEVGLPARLTGLCMSSEGTVADDLSLSVQRKEIVIENDIAWRINTLVDFAIGQMPAISSLAKDDQKRRAIYALLQQVIANSGGLATLQHMTLLGAVQGSVFIYLHVDEALVERIAEKKKTQVQEWAEGETAAPGEERAASEAGTPELQQTIAEEWGEKLRLELIDAARVLPLASGRSPAADAGDAEYVFILDTDVAPAVRQAGPESLRRITGWLRRRVRVLDDEGGESGVLWSRDHWWRFREGKLVAEGENPLGFVPVIRYVSQVAPGCGGESGTSEVEPLICLQDELNTRLSDRANRVTMQSFKMYLARGLSDFMQRPIGPGQMWQTDNKDASIETFGGDSSCPSEDLHISEVRRAIDKISGVPPVAAGLIDGRVGNLTSAIALKLTMTSLLTRTERRRGALGHVIALLCERILRVYSDAGVLVTAADERAIDINWPSCVPENISEKLEEAKLKLQLGVPQRVVLRELGYEELEVERGAGEQRGEFAGGEEGNAGGSVGEEGGGGSAGDGGVFAGTAEGGGEVKATAIA